ncbi:MAG: four helix bundle protein [Ferruginibacter sp.]
MTTKQENTNALQLPPIVEEYYEFCVWLLPKVSKFQKDQKYILGVRLQNSALQALEHIVDAALSEKSKKEPHLSAAILKLEHVRYNLRLSVQVKMVNPKSYAFGSMKILDISQKLGAWRKSVKDA